MNTQGGKITLIEQWGPNLFLVSGVLLIGHATVQSIEAFTQLATPPDVFATTGHLVALVGLVSLYPALVDRLPRLARMAVAVAVVPLVGWALLSGTQLLTVAGIGASLTEAIPAVLSLLVIGSTIFAYTLFGIATVHVGTDARAVGALVLAPAVLLTTLLVTVAVTSASALVGVIIGGGLALVLLALGYRLRRWDRSTGHAVSVGDLTTG